MHRYIGRKRHLEINLSNLHGTSQPTQVAQGSPKFLTISKNWDLPNFFNNQCMTLPQWKKKKYISMSAHNFQCCACCLLSQDSVSEESGPAIPMHCAELWSLLAAFPSKAEQTQSFNLCMVSYRSVTGAFHRAYCKLSCRESPQQTILSAHAPSGGKTSLPSDNSQRYWYTIHHVWTMFCF